MRRGSAAIVPLFIAVLLLFWYIAFMGSENDNLHTVNEVTNLQRTQDKLLLPAIKYRYQIEQEAKANGETLSKAEFDQKVNEYVNFMMVQNDIQSAAAPASASAGDASSGSDASGGNGSSNANENGSASSNAGDNGNMNNNGNMGNN